MSIIEKALNKIEDEKQKLINTPDFSAETAKDNYLDRTVDVADLTGDIGREEENNIDDKQPVDISLERLAGLGFITNTEAHTQAIEEYRNIKRRLVDNAFGPASAGITRSNLILITSSVSGEGKSYTALNLALSIANERDKKVLLIDADVARPSIARMLGIDVQYGLMDYLENDHLSYTDIEYKTNMPGLSLILSGKRHRHSTELLASNKMTLFAEELSNRYSDRIVIFDSPPLLAATQAVVLAKLVGQVVLVIESEETLQSLVMASVEKLADCDVVLAVLNKCKTGLLDRYCYGQYGQYGLYGQYGQK